MGRFIPLLGVNPPATRPKVNVAHPLLPENGGALLLTEPGLVERGWSAGVPGSGARVPNIAKDQARAVITALTDTTADPQFYYGQMTVSGTPRGKIERTSKGGIHSLYRPADETVTTSVLSELHSQLRLSTDYVNWFQLHADDHDFYFSQWYVDTRLPDVSGITNPQAYDTSGGVGSAAAGSGNFLTLFGAEAVQNGDLGKVDPVGGVGVAKRMAVGTTDRVGTNALSYAYMMYSGTGPSPMNNYTVSGYGKRRSRAFYLSYIEDLTVSGRTFAQVNAIDAAAFAAAFGVGGRYAGDTWTNPETWTP